MNPFSHLEYLNQISGENSKWVFDVGQMYIIQ